MLLNHLINDAPSRDEQASTELKFHSVLLNAEYRVDLFLAHRAAGMFIPDVLCTLHAPQVVSTGY
jgi:hypothetical protein